MSALPVATSRRSRLRQDGAGPDPRGPEHGATSGVGTRSSRSAPCRRKYVSPLGRSRAGAPWAWRGAERRLVGGQDPAVADRRAHRRERCQSASNAARPSAGAMPAHCANAAGRRRARRRARTGARARGGPHAGRPRGRARSRSSAGARRPSGSATVPVGAAYRRRLGWSRARRRPRRRSSSGRRGRRARRAARSSARPPALAPSGSRPSEKTAQVPRRDDVRAEPRTPELDERGVLPGRRPGALDPRMDRQERGARHAVLQAGPRGAPERRRGRRAAARRAPGPCRR